LHVFEVASHHRFGLEHSVGAAGQFSVEPHPVVQGSPAFGGFSQISVSGPLVMLVQTRLGSQREAPTQDWPTLLKAVHVPGHPDGLLQ
jgi:hypothetical protein